MRTTPAAVGLVVGLATLHVAPAHAYSVMAHEAAIDVVWESGVKPLLLRRYHEPLRSN